MGKTSLLIKLEAELLAAGRTVVRVSAETSSQEVFAERLLTQLRANRIIRDRVDKWQKEIQGSVGPAIGQTGFKLTGTAKRSLEEPHELDVIDLVASAGGHAGTC